MDFMKQKLLEKALHYTINFIRALSITRNNPVNTINFRLSDTDMKGIVA
jgi:hypothetical protein